MGFASTLWVLIIQSGRRAVSLTRLAAVSHSAAMGGRHAAWVGACSVLPSPPDPGRRETHAHRKPVPAHPSRAAAAGSQAATRLAAVTHSAAMGGRHAAWVGASSVPRRRSVLPKLLPPLLLQAQFRCHPCKYPARWVISCSKVLAETVGTVVFLVEFICLRARCVENANRVCRAAPDAGLRMVSRWNQPRNCATVRTVGLRCRCSPPGGPALHMHRRPPPLPLYSVRAGRFNS